MHRQYFLQGLCTLLASMIDPTASGRTDKGRAWHGLSGEGVSSWEYDHLNNVYQVQYCRLQHPGQCSAKLLDSEIWQNPFHRFVALWGQGDLARRGWACAGECEPPSGILPHHVFFEFLPSFPGRQCTPLGSSAGAGLPDWMQQKGVAFFPPLSACSNLNSLATLAKFSGALIQLSRDCHQATPKILVVAFVSCFSGCQGLETDCIYIGEMGLLGPSFHKVDVFVAALVLVP